MKIRGVDFVMLAVSDLARAARFYRETLGLPQEVYSEEWQWAEFDCGNLTLSLKGDSAPASRAPYHRSMGASRLAPPDGLSGFRKPGAAGPALPAGRAPDRQSIGNSREISLKN